MDERKKLVDQIIENMKNGYLIPKSQWNAAAFQIHNPISGARYHGANMLKLYLTSINNGYQDNRWMTFKQAASKGYHVKQGEKGIRLEKYIFDKVIEKENPDTRKMEKVRVKLSKPMINTFVVFNGEQIEGIPELVMPEIKQQDSEIWDIADNLIASSECPIKEEPQGQAYYSPQRDSITLPPREIFTSPEAFTTTLIHEMCHSTGHESRLNRNLINSFGSPEYALEELRAELGAFFMGSDLGIEGSEELLASHTQYLESWISVLENDPNELFRAMSDSQKAVDRLTDNLEQYRKKMNEAVAHQDVDEMKEVINLQEPVKMDLDEYLGMKGLSSPISDYSLDKTRIPKGETLRQKQQRIKDTERAIEDYSQRRNDAIEEYNTKVAEGEFIPKTQFERILEKAQGHPDNSSTQAARKLLVKRGFMSEMELNENIKKWDEKIPQKVAIESTHDYSEPGFTYMESGDMPAGTKYRLVTIGEKGSLVSYEQNVIFTNRDEIDQYIEEHKEIDVIAYDDMVYQAGAKKSEYTMMQHQIIDNGLHSFEFEDGYLHFGIDVNDYSYDGLYRIYDPLNGKSRIIVNITCPSNEPVITENIDYIKSCLNQYVNEHPQIGLDGKPVPRERPTIYCEWSEHGAFQEETVYDASEFNKIMERVDQEKVNLNKRIASLGEPVATNIGNVPLIDYLDIQASNYGYDSYENMLDEGMSIEEYSYVTKELIDKWRHNEQYLYDKVKYEIYVPGMTEITVRQDIGDGFGSVKSFLQQNGYQKYAEQLTEWEQRLSQIDKVTANIPSEEKLNNAIDKVMEQMNLPEPDMALEL